MTIFKEVIKKIESDLDAGMWDCAKESWAHLSPEFKNSISGQLLQSRWMAGLNRTAEAIQILEAINPEKTTPDQLRQLKQLKRLIFPKESVPDPKIRLPDTLARQQQQLANLLRYANMDPYVVTSLIRSMVANKEFTHLASHFLIQCLKHHDELWPLLIQELFSVTTKINPRPLVTWKNWLRDCPASHKKALFSAMEKHLGLHPDYRMEYWLKKQLFLGDHKSDFGQMGS